MKCRLIYVSSKGAFPISEETLQILYDSVKGITTKEVAAKMLLAMCLFGHDSDRAQDMYHLVKELEIKEKT